MTKREFLKKNRKELDAHIVGACSNIGKLNDDERWMWVMNDEYLYLWAKREGVRV